LRMIRESANNVKLWFAAPYKWIPALRSESEIKFWIRMNHKRRFPATDDIKSIWPGLGVSEFSPVFKFLTGTYTKFWTFLDKVEFFHWEDRSIDGLLKKSLLGYPLVPSMFPSRQSPKWTSWKVQGKWAIKLVRIIYFLERDGRYYRVFTIMNLLFFHVVLYHDRVRFIVSRSPQKVVIERLSNRVLPRGWFPGPDWKEYGYPYSDHWSVPSHLKVFQQNYYFSRLFNVRDPNRSRAVFGNRGGLV
jgi:hypothetical protein